MRRVLSGWCLVSLIFLTATHSAGFAQEPDDDFRCATDPLYDAMRDSLGEGPEGTETALILLLKKRCQAEFVSLDNRFKLFLCGKGTNPFLFQNTRRLIDAALELLEESKDRPTQLKLLEANVALAQEEARTVRRRLDAGRVDPLDDLDARTNLLDAQIRLLKFQRD